MLFGRNQFQQKYCKPSFMQSLASILIVVPTLNSYHLLGRLVKSLQIQSYQNWRLVFVDGHSCLEHRNWLDCLCYSESRCSWVFQDPRQNGIFGAMNQGFAIAKPDDWLLFWGSDDWAASPTVIGEAMAALNVCSLHQSDLLICNGRYVNSTTGELGRCTSFNLSLTTKSTFCCRDYRRAMMLGFTPPHQTTLIGPGARARLARYADGFRLSADLDYFLQLSRFDDLRLKALDLELVHISSGGISGQQTQRRLQEVRRAYQRAFGRLWWLPFIARYVRRIFSLLVANR